MDVPRAVVLLRVARFEGPVQADGDRRGVGGVAAVDEHGRVHAFLRAAGEITFRRIAVSRVLFRSVGSLDVLFDGADNGDECRGGEPEGDHESVFSEVNIASFERGVRAGGFWNCIRSAACTGAGIRAAAGCACDLVAIVAVAGAGDGAGGGIVAFGAECVVPRRAVCNAIPGAVLDAGVAGGVSEQSCASEVAVAVRAEPHGGSA